MIDTWHTTAEIDAVIAAVLPRTHDLRMAWEAADNDDKPALIATAQADMDAVAWAGVRASTTQTNSWPRVIRGETIAEAALPDGVAAWTVAGIPGAVRVAHAVQAAAHASQALGHDGTRKLLDDAAAGVVGVSGGGQSYSLDAERASRPRMRLHPLARQHAAVWLRHTAEVL